MPGLVRPGAVEQLAGLEHPAVECHWLGLPAAVPGCRIRTGGGVSPKPGGDAQVVVFKLPGAELEGLQWAGYDGNKYGLTHEDDSKDLEVFMLSDPSLCCRTTGASLVSS